MNPWHTLSSQISKTFHQLKRIYCQLEFCSFVKIIIHCAVQFSAQNRSGWRSMVAVYLRQDSYNRLNHLEKNMMSFIYNFY